MTDKMSFLPADHPAVALGRIGVLLVNLGTPDAPTPQAVKRYLGEFLSDRRVIELPPWIWQPILRGIILNVRPRRSAAAYAQIWDDKGGDSPLRLITRAQAQALSDLGSDLGSGLGGDRVVIDWAMRYGRPAIADRLKGLKDAGCDRILIVPLYPQYSGATTASVHDAVARSMQAMRWQPALRFLPPYYDDPLYIRAVADSLSNFLHGLDFTPDLILTSFHGMPERTLHQGDPYHCHCMKTGRLLRTHLQWPEEKMRVTFQSRFGFARWLQPYTDKTLRSLPEQGVRDIVVVAPGFSADCLETLEEIAMQGRETFLEAGGRRFAYAPCLNDSPEGMEMLRALVRRELAGWSN